MKIKIDIGVVGKGSKVCLTDVRKVSKRIEESKGKVNAVLGDAWR